MKIRNNAPILKEEKQRLRWPFTTMKVNSVVDIEDKKDWLGATRRAHTTAMRKGWKIHTQWLKKKGFGRIRRIK